MCNVEGPPLKKLRPQLLHSVDPMPIYLDYNATTPVGHAAWAAMQRCKDHWGNPSSTHPYGLDANYVVSTARHDCAAALGVVDDRRVIFTSGGTEANNLAIVGGARAARAASIQSRAAGSPSGGEATPSAIGAVERDVILATNFEHPAVEEVLRSMETLYRDRWITKRVPVDPSTGVLSPAALRAYLLTTSPGVEGLGLDPRRVALVTIMHANNELGSIQPIAALVEVVKSVCGRGALFHTDAAQTIGKIPVHMGDLGVDYLSVCSHKFYGPKGAGALCLGKDAPVPLRTTFGAGHEFGVRPGTENIILNTGMAAALTEACRYQSTNATHMRQCRDALLSELEVELNKKRGMALVVNGSLADALPNTLNLAIYHQPSQTFISAQRLMLELGHIVCMSAGSACHSSLGEGEEIVISAPLKAVGVDEARAVGTLRLTCGTNSTLEEMRRAARFIARRSIQQVSDW